MRATDMSGTQKPPVEVKDKDREEELAKNQEASEVKHDIMSYEEFKKLEKEEKRRILSKYLERYKPKKLAEKWSVQTSTVRSQKQYLLNNPKKQQSAEENKNTQPEDPAPTPKEPGEFEIKVNAEYDSQEVSERLQSIASMIPDGYFKIELKLSEIE